MTVSAAIGGLGIVLAISLFGLAVALFGINYQLGRIAKALESKRGIHANGTEKSGT